MFAIGSSTDGDTSDISIIPYLDSELLIGMFNEARFCPIVASEEGRHISACAQSMSQFTTEPSTCSRHSET
jgi:hypothetical protein